MSSHDFKKSFKQRKKKEKRPWLLVRGLLRHTMSVIQFISLKVLYKLTTNQMRRQIKH